MSSPAESITYLDRDVLPPVIHTLSGRERVTVASKRAPHVSALRAQRAENHLYRDAIVLNTARRAFAIVSSDTSYDEEDIFLKRLTQSTQEVCADKSGGTAAIAQKHLQMQGEDRERRIGTGSIMRANNSSRQIELLRHTGIISDNAGRETIGYGVDYNNHDFRNNYCSNTPKTRKNPGEGRLILLSTGLVESFQNNNLASMGPGGYDISFKRLLENITFIFDAPSLAEHIIWHASNDKRGQKNPIQCADLSVIIWDVDPL